MQPGRGSSTPAPRYLIIAPRLFDTGADPAELHSLAGAAGDDVEGRTPGEQPLEAITLEGNPRTPGEQTSPSRVTL